MPSTYQNTRKSVKVSTYFSSPQNFHMTKDRCQFIESRFQPLVLQNTLKHYLLLHKWDKTVCYSLPSLVVLQWLRRSHPKIILPTSCDILSVLHPLTRNQHTLWILHRSIVHHTKKAQVWVKWKPFYKYLGSILKQEWSDLHHTHFCLPSLYP